MSEDKNVSIFSLKNICTSVSILLTLCAIIVSSIMTGNVLGKFSSDAIMAPIRLMIQFMPSTIVLGILAIGLIYLGRTKSKLWYLISVGILIIGIYWFTAGIIVVKTLENAMKNAG